MKRFSRRFRHVVPLVALSLLALTACEDSTGPEDGVSREVAIVLNSTERSLTVFPVDSLGPSFTVGVGPEGSPVSVAARGTRAIVPLGTYPFAAVIDLETRSVAHTVPLPAGSGATGAAFLNDSIALIGNPELNTVTPVNVLRGTALAEISVGPYPQELVEGDGRVYVVNANLVNFAPAGPGSVSVIDESLTVTGTISLGGTNPGSGAIGDGLLYVVNSGSFGMSNGSLSVVSLATGSESLHLTGLGNFPSGIAVTEDHVFIGLYSDGLLQFDPVTNDLVRGPDNPLTPGQIPPVSGLGADSEGRLFALNPGTCENPGNAYRFSENLAVAGQAPTGVCPFDLAFTFLPED